MIGQTVSHYRIEKRLGGGGMGDVYLAQDTALERRQVAIKVLRPELVAQRGNRTRLLAEANMIASLQHPYICEIHDVGELEEGHLFLVMAYYSGGTLRERMRRPMAAAEAVSVALAIARAIGHAHEQGIVHRDIKPSNIMFTGAGFLKIVDFGLARLADTTRMTRSGAACGTAAYMAPEQTVGEDVDGRADIWALGVVLQEMLTGGRPFSGDNPGAMAYAIRHTDPVPMPQDGEGGTVAPIVERCLKKDPAERYPSAAALVKDLLDLRAREGWTSSLEIEGTLVSAGASDGKTDGKTEEMSGGRADGSGIRFPGALRAIAAAAVLALAVWWFFSRDPPADPDPFQTKMRVAVLDIEDRGGQVSSSGLAAALAQVASEMLSVATAGDPDRWAAWYRHVRSAPAWDAESARLALGVTHVVEGDIQRAGEDPRLTLRLVDAVTSRVAGTTAVEFSGADYEQLRTGLPEALRGLLGLPESGDRRMRERLPDRHAAVAAYLQGLLHLPEDPARAAADFAACVAEAPGFLPGYAQQGRALMTSTGFDSAGAVEALRVMEPLRASLAEAAPVDLRPLGDGYLYAHRWDEAEAVYRAALDRDPSESYAANRMAQILRGEGRTDEAQAILRDAVRRRPDYFVTHRDLADYFYSLGHYDDAAASYEDVLRLAPNDAASLNGLGGVRHGQGNWPEARTLFERSFRIQPTYWNSSNVGSMYFFEGDFENSAKFYETALAYADTTTLAPWVNLATSLYWIPEQRERAEELLGKAVRKLEEERDRRPDDIQTRVDLADYYAMLGMDSEARREIDAVRGVLGDDSHRHYQIGCSLELIGERNDALQHISRAYRDGYPLAILQGTPELHDLLNDVRFQELLGPGEGDAPAE